MLTLLDPVALLADDPVHGLTAGQVGTVVEVYGDAYEVEFADPQGKTFAMATLTAEALLKLRYAASLA